jgi:transcriptional regulator with XRE-family HTH domain
MNPWGSMLYDLQSSSGLSMVELCERAGLARPGVVAAAKGRRPIPITSATALADALRLERVQRERFMLLADLTHAPERVQRRMAELESRIASLTLELARLEERES